MIPAGRPLFKEGDPSSRAYFLIAGAVCVSCVVEVERPLDDEKATMHDSPAGGDGKPGRSDRLRNGVGRRKKTKQPTAGPIKQHIELENVSAPRIVGLVDVAARSARRTHDCVVTGDLAVRAWVVPGSIMRALMLNDRTHGGRMLCAAAKSQAKWYAMVREEGKEGMRAGVGLLGDLQVCANVDAPSRMRAQSD